MILGGDIGAAGGQIPDRLVTTAVAVFQLDGITAQRESGQLMAYGADVMSVEPPQPSNPLLRCPNAYLTPHIAWATFEARQRLMQIAVDNLQCFIDGQPQNVVG